MNIATAHALCVQEQNSYLPNPAPHDIFVAASDCLEAITRVFNQANGELAYCTGSNALVCYNELQDTMSNDFVRVLQSFGLM